MHSMIQYSSSDQGNRPNACYTRPGRCLLSTFGTMLFCRCVHFSAPRTTTVSRPPLLRHFPSWSWASIGTHVTFLLDDESIEPVNTYVELCVDEDGTLTISGQRPLPNWSVQQCTPQDERIRFSSPISNVHIIALFTREEWQMKDESGITIGVALPDYQVSAADSIVTLPLLQDEGYRVSWALLIRRSQESPWAYERVGAALIDLDLLDDPWFSGSDECVHTFIA